MHDFPRFVLLMKEWPVLHVYKDVVFYLTNVTMHVRLGCEL